MSKAREYFDLLSIPVAGVLIMVATMIAGVLLPNNIAAFIGRAMLVVPIAVATIVLFARIERELRKTK